MLIDNIKRVKELILIKDDKTLQANSLILPFQSLIENSYFAPSYIMADDIQVKELKKIGYWIELRYKAKEQFKDYTFDTLLIPIKPKCDWLTLYRGNNGDFNGKCLNLNLSIKTTDFYKLIKDFEGDSNEA